MEEVAVIIVGAGPSGIATSACLNRLKIPNIVLEREDCCGSLWKKRAYDRLKLHIPKQYCELPYMPYPSNSPTFVPRNGFIAYLDEYVSHFVVIPRYNRSVELAFYDPDAGKWRIEVKNVCSHAREVYAAQFLVVATGENAEGVIPDVPGLAGFAGEYMHASQFSNGRKYIGKDVLVVGSGNSGMEISYDLCQSNARTAIVNRSPVHVVTKEMVSLAMFLLKFLTVATVDKILVRLCKLRFRDLSKYGIQRPKEGPFFLKTTKGRSPTIDVGCVDKIKRGKIKVFPSIANIDGKKIEFMNGESNQFDAIIFATGYRSTVGRWLKGGEELFDDNGFPKRNLLNKWKGSNGLYCVGFARNGLLAISNDAKNVSQDISTLILNSRNLLTNIM